MGLMRGIRKNVRGIYLVVTVAVVVTFVFWGTRTGLEGGHKYVGTAFGKKVSVKEFRRQWLAARERAMEIEFQTGQVVDNEQLEYMAWRRIAELSEVDRWGIIVPMNAVKERIRLMFSREGAFDEDLYQNYLYRRGLTEEQFASIVRDNMKIGTLERVVSTTVAVPPEELRQKHDYEQEQRKIKFHMVEVDSLLPAFEISGEGEQYYQAHKEEFRQPKKVAVQYSMVRSEPFLEKVIVSEEELKSYYEQNKSSYQANNGETAEFADVRAQIEQALRKEKADEMARKKAEEVLTFSEASKMREIAQENDVESGETGLIPEDGPVSDELGREPEFRKAAFGTDLGKVSPVIKTNVGYCVLSPIRIVPERMPPFEEVRKEAAEKQRTQQLREAAVRAGVPPDRIDEFVAEYSMIAADVDVTYEEALQYYESRKSREFRKPKKVKVQYLIVEKAPFEKEVEITEKEIKADYEDNEWKYKDDKGKVKPLDTVKEEIKKTLTEQKADGMARERADEIFIFGRPQRMKQQAIKYGLELWESRLFAQGEMIDDFVGESPVFASTALNTGVGEVSSVFRTDKGYCVLSPVQIVEEAVADFEEVAEEAAQKAMADKAQNLAGQIARELYRQVSEKMSREKKDFEAACKELGLGVEESAYFKRDDRQIDKIGAAMGHIATIFREEPGQIRYPRLIPEKGHFFYVVSEVKPPSEEEFAKEKDRYYSRMAAEKGQEAFREWMSALMEKANVKSYLQPPAQATPEKGSAPGKGSKPVTPRKASTGS